MFMLLIEVWHFLNSFGKHAIDRIDENNNGRHEPDFKHSYLFIPGQMMSFLTYYTIFEFPLLLIDSLGRRYRSYFRKPETDRRICF